MSFETEDRGFDQHCLAACGVMAQMLKEYEEVIESSGVTEQFPAEEVVAGGFLMLFCGMLADPDGGRSLLMESADKLRASNLPMGEDIRTAAEALLNTLGMKRTSHLMN